MFLYDLLKYIHKKGKLISMAEKTATVVIPVYNGVQHLEILIPSLIKNITIAADSKYKFSIYVISPLIIFCIPNTMRPVRTIYYRITVKI